MNKTYVTVYYADTDAYGVVWHGNYLRWMEVGRINFCEEHGFKMSEMYANDVILPIANIEISYKKSAKLEDKLIIETEIKEITRLSIVFKQIIKDATTEEICTSAVVKVVAINREGKLYRTFPNIIKKFIEKQNNVLTTNIVT